MLLWRAWLWRPTARGLCQQRRFVGCLAFETRIQLDAFLKNHEIYDYTVSDFENDRETLRQLRVREPQH